jgi:hypothetical protein
MFQQSHSVGIGFVRYGRVFVCPLRCGFAIVFLVYFAGFLAPLDSSSSAAQLDVTFDSKSLDFDRFLDVFVDYFCATLCFSGLCPLRLYIHYVWIDFHWSSLYSV